MSVGLYPFAVAVNPFTNKIYVANPRSNDVTVINGTTVVTVLIDIKPGEDPASINPMSTGVTPVAILSTSTFDATQVDPLSVRFGPNRASAVQSSIQDVNGDGLPDLVLQFNTQATGIRCGDTSAALTGKTFGGQAIQGTDSIQTVGCK